MGLTPHRSLRAYAEQKFARDKVKIKGGSKITAVGPDWLELEGKEKGEEVTSQSRCFR
jgi:NADH dehydrogenase FAD-containing subunit